MFHPGQTLFGLCSFTRKVCEAARLQTLVAPGLDEALWHGGQPGWLWDKLYGTQISDVRSGCRTNPALLFSRRQPSFIRYKLNTCSTR